VRPHARSVRSIVAMTSSRSNGLSMNSFAPCFIASTAIGTVPCALSMITGRSGTLFPSAASSAMPSIPGMRTSVTTRSIGVLPTSSSAFSADGTARAVYPACFKSPTSTNRSASSSSTTKMFSPAMDPLGDSNIPSADASARMTGQCAQPS